MELDYKAKASKYFTFHELFWLPKWNRYATKEDGINQTIITNAIMHAKKMDVIREWFQRPINIHCWYRPEEYNKQIGGASKSSHIKGLACDFHVGGLNCDDVRKNIVDNKLLEKLDLRCEDLPESGWVHLDSASVITKRFFKP